MTSHVAINNKQTRHHKLITEDQFRLEEKRLQEYWAAFLHSHVRDVVLTQGVDYFVHSRNLYEVFMRLYKKLDYYSYFHKINDANEYRHVGILCYWLIKLKPFFVTKEQLDIYNSPNERFAFFLIISTIRSIFSKVCPEENFNYPSEIFERNNLYDFKYCVWDEESMIRFVETFAISYGIGPDKVNNNDLHNK